MSGAGRVLSPYASPVLPGEGRGQRRRKEQRGSFWRRACEAGVERARAAKLSADTRRRSRLAETERRYLLVQIAELSAWWDGPGSEGRCA